MGGKKTAKWLLKTKKGLLAFDQNRRHEVTETTFSRHFTSITKLPCVRVSGKGSYCLSKVAKVNIMAAISV